jgi:hypothetical protein
MINAASAFIRDTGVPAVIGRKPITRVMTCRTIKTKHSRMKSGIAVTTCTGY